MPVDKSTLSYLLNRVDKPGRYTGREVGSCLDKKGWNYRVALAFPDIYEIGMSNLGIRILYHRINSHPDYFCERVFSPWTDLEELLRKENIPVFSLETHSFLSEFDAVGLSMQTELSVINGINLLELGHIPIFSSQRAGQTSPFIFCGGQGISNPEPYSDFFDFFFLGEADKAIIDILGILSGGGERARILEKLSGIRGVYVPSFYRPRYINGIYDGTECLKEEIAAPHGHFEIKVPESTAMNRMLPNVKPVHNRAVIEAARGCVNGCRFCQSGYISRPYRPKSADSMITELLSLLDYGFYESLTLLSLNIEDYPGLDSLLPEIIDLTKEHKINISLPSIRASMLDDSLAGYISCVRKAGFTIAPEAGSQRLRNIINKNISEREILDACGYAYANGWDLIKCYFMIGLPGETESDIEDIIILSSELSRTGSRIRNRAGRLNLGISPFVPKAFTPFQWAAFEHEEKLSQKIGYIRRNIRNKKIVIKDNSPYMAFAEAVLSTGDRRLGAVLYDIFMKGERFSNWGDFFRYDIWKESLRCMDYPYETIYSERDCSRALPYDHIKPGISSEFLKKEWDRSKDAVQTKKCSASFCNNCGIGSSVTCFSRAVRQDMNRVPVPDAMPDVPLNSSILRLVYQKRDLARYLGNMDTIESLRRMIKILKLPVEYSRGYNPAPVYNALPPLPLGMEGENEIFDIHLTSRVNVGRDDMNRLLPDGIRITGLYFTDKYDILLKKVNMYVLGIITECMDFNRFSCLMREFGSKDKYHIKDLRNHGWGYTFSVLFKKEEPFSLRKFYDFISENIDDSSRISRIFSLIVKEELPFGK